MRNRKKEGGKRERNMKKRRIEIHMKEREKQKYRCENEKGNK
jgi:hypothetical protein